MLMYLEIEGIYKLESKLEYKIFFVSRVRSWLFKNTVLKTKILCGCDSTG